MVYLKSIELSKAFLHLVKKGFIILEFKNNVLLELNDAIEVDEVIVNKLVDNMPFVVLVDARDVTSSITPKAREFFANDEMVLKIRKAHAIVVNSLHTKLLANFYMKFHKPINPIKIFSDYDKAIDWIETIRKEHY